MVINVFDKTYTSSKTPINKEGSDKSPKPYIEVNPFKENPEFGSIIVRFEWDSFIESLTKRFDTKSKNEVKQFLFGHLPYSNNNKFVFEDFNKEINREVNKNLLSVRVNLGDRLGSSSASIVLANFNYEWIIQTKVPGLEFLFGETIFQESLYLTIDAKGRYDPNKYYRIFTGSIMSTTIIDNPVDRKITIECADLSKLLRYSRYNVHPSFLESDFTAVQGQPTVFANNIQKMSGVDIAKKVIPDIDRDAPRIKVDTFPVNNFKKEMWKYVNPYPLRSGRNDFGAIDIPVFNNQFSYLVQQASYDTKFNVFSPQAIIYGDTNLNGDVMSVYHQMFNISALRVSEFKSRADLLTEVASLTFFATYLDGSGNIHFHPYKFDAILEKTQIKDNIDPELSIYEGLKRSMLDSQNLIGNLLPASLRLNLEEQIKEHSGLYKLNFDEIISETYTQSEEDIITNLKVLGEMDFGIYSTIQKLINPNFYRVNIAWPDGLRMYGYRERKVSTPAFGNNIEALKLFGVALFFKLFLERKKATFSIPLTPELQVDRPYFVPYKQMMYHIRGVTHSYSAGGERSPGEWTTTINCFGGRPANMMSMIHTNLFRTTNLEDVLKRLTGKFDLMIQLEGKGLT